MRRSYVSYFLALASCAVTLLLESCAAQAPPPGGPEDKTPPKVDTTTPHDRQINVPTDTRIYFRFDRDVDRASFQSAFSITPYLNGTPKYHWSGHKEVIVELPERLRDSTTYTVQLTRDLKSRRGNTLLNPARITFATGPLIDTGSLAGFLLTPISGQQLKASEIFIFAYDITVRNPDTLNLSHTAPDLLTQPSDQGTWQFLSMKVGHHYRVFAVADAYRNHVYDPGVDAFGVPTGDVFLDSASKSNVFIRMSPMKDTIPPELQDAEVVDSFHVRAHFSEAIDSNSVHAGNFVLSGIPIVAAFRENPERKPGQITLLTAAPLAPNANYTLEARRDSVRDLGMNEVSDSACKVTFSAPLTLRSAIAPKFSFIGIRDSALDIPTMPSILVTFSDAVNWDSLKSTICLIDSGGRAVAMNFQRSDDQHVYLTTRDSLLSNVLYTIRIRKGGIQSPISAIRDTAKDTTIRFRFRTTSARDFGKLSGEITIADSFFSQNPAGALVVQVFQTPANIIRQMVLPHGTKHYFFEQVPNGTFRVRGYYTRSGSSEYESGTVSPWKPGLPSGDYPREVTTRPRWEMSKIDFEVR